MKDWRTLLNWLDQQADLTLTEAAGSFGPNQQAALLKSFQRYASLAAPPKLKGLTDVVGRETADYLILVAQAMPTASEARQKGIATNLMLALLRFILATTSPEKPPPLAEYIATVEANLMRTMVEQGVDQAYPILKRAGLIATR